MENPSLHNSHCSHINSQKSQLVVLPPGTNLPQALSEQSRQTPATVPPPAPTQLEVARSLLPREVTERRFRARSFMSSLSPEQRALVLDWLRTDNIDVVRDRITSPRPKGFGLNVCSTTLYRLKEFVRNSMVSIGVSRAMDTASDLLSEGDAGDVAPLRETLSLLLYSRAVNLASSQNPAAPETLDKLLSAITKIEKVKALSHPASGGTPTTRHLVELSVAQPSNAGPKQ